MQQGAGTSVLPLQDGGSPLLRGSLKGAELAAGWGSGLGPGCRRERGRVRALLSSRRRGGAGLGRSLPRHIALPPALLTCLLPPRRRRPPTWPQPRRRTPGCCSPCCCSCPRRPPSSPPPPGPTRAAASPSASAAPTPTAAVSGGRRGRAEPRPGSGGWRQTPARELGWVRGESRPSSGLRHGREAAELLREVAAGRCRRRMSHGRVSQSPPRTPCSGTEPGPDRQNGNPAPACVALSFSTKCSELPQLLRDFLSSKTPPVIPPLSGCCLFVSIRCHLLGSLNADN